MVSSLKACLLRLMIGRLLMCYNYNRLVGEGLNPEKINIKALLVSFCSARYQE